MNLIELLCASVIGGLIVWLLCLLSLSINQHTGCPLWLSSMIAVAAGIAVISMACSIAKEVKRKRDP